MYIFFHLILSGIIFVQRQKHFRVKTLIELWMQYKLQLYNFILQIKVKMNLRHDYDISTVFFKIFRRKTNHLKSFSRKIILNMQKNSNSIYVIE